MMPLDFGLELLPPDGWDMFERNIRSIPSLPRSFSTLWLCDHFQFGSQRWPEGWTTLSYLAAKHPDFKFGHLVIGVGYRNPALLAKMGVTLQDLTGGRFILGLGAGWHKDEYLSYGYDFPRHAERIDRLGEAVELIREMWKASPATYQGRYHRVVDAFCEPRPDRPIPILIGGESEKICDLAARLGDIWNASGPTTRFKPAYEKLRTACASVGRDFATVTLTCIIEPYIRDDPAEFEQNPSNGRIGPNASDVIEELHALAKMGVSHVQVRSRDSRSLEAFCRKVVPEVKDLTE